MIKFFYYHRVKHHVVKETKDGEIDLIIYKYFKKWWRYEIEYKEDFESRIKNGTYAFKKE